MNFPKRKNIKEEVRQQLIIVGSKNPVKISCTDVGFHAAFDGAFLVEGLNVSSDVPDQPIGDEQTLLGATNRAKNAKVIFPEADYWVGIEGGITSDNNEMEAYAWVVIIDKNNQIGKAKTATFYLPKQITKLVAKGMELGDAMDKVFEEENSKQGSGAVGLLTNGVLGRKEYYQQAIILALIPFIKDGLYEDKL